MKLGFIGLNDLAGVEADARFAAKHGFVGIEYNYWRSFDELTLDLVGKMADILGRFGVKVSDLGLWGWNHISPDPEERRVSLGHLEQAIRFAERLKAEVLITGGGKIPEASLDQNVAEFARVFPPYVQRAKDAGLKVALYAVHGNSFLESIDAYRKVWELVPEVGIKLDPANLLHHGDQYLPILRDHGDRVYHVHIKEHLYLDGQLVSQPAAGMGDLQWGKVMALLYEHAYAGYLSIEPHGPIWGKAPLRQKMLLLTQRHIAQFII